MATQTRTETKVVEEEKEFKICDYCQLVTEDDIDDDEEFHEMLLNPQYYLDVDYHDKDLYKSSFVKRIQNDLANRGIKTFEDMAEKDNFELSGFLESIWRDAFKQVMGMSHSSIDGTADLCPNCKKQLFEGEDAIIGVRAGTGMLSLDE